MYIFLLRTLNSVTVRIAPYVDDVDDVNDYDNLWSLLLFVK